MTHLDVGVSVEAEDGAIGGDRSASLQPPLSEDIKHDFTSERLAHRTGYAEI